MERPALAQLASAGRDLGAMVTGDLGRVEYQIGVFAGDGRGRASRAKLDLGRPRGVADDARRRGRRIGIDRAAPKRWTSCGQRARRPHVVGLPVLRSRLRGRPAGAVGRRRRVVARAVAAHRRGPARGGFARRAGPRLRGSCRAWRHWDGASRWSGSSGGAAGRPRVRLREFDLGIRLDGLGFDDTGPATDRSSTRLRATDIRARSARSATVTASWQPTRWSRILLNGGVDTFSDAPGRRPRPGKTVPTGRQERGFSSSFREVFGLQSSVYGPAKNAELVTIWNAVR